jgi:hypothetical protein
MRRLLVLFAIALLAIAPLGGRSVSALDLEGDWGWEGVDLPKPPGDAAAADEGLKALLGESGNLRSELTPLEVTFRNPGDLRSAYIPELVGVEFMAVVVNSGDFILDVKGPGSYLIEPRLFGGDDTIEIMVGRISDDRMTSWYEETNDYILDEKGNVCTTRCTVLPGTVVRVSAGNGIIAPAGAICVWCLLHQDKNGAAVMEGRLFVYPLLRDNKVENFSWIRYYDPPLTSAQATSEATPSASLTDPGMPDVGPVTMAWAFNPAPGCQKGPGG